MYLWTFHQICPSFLPFVLSLLSTAPTLSLKIYLLFPHGGLQSSGWSGRMSDHHILTFRQPLGPKGQLWLKTSHLLPALVVWKSSTICHCWSTGVNLHQCVTLLAYPLTILSSALTSPTVILRDSVTAPLFPQVLQVLWDVAGLLSLQMSSHCGILSIVQTVLLFFKRMRVLELEVQPAIVFVLILVLCVFWEGFLKITKKIHNNCTEGKTNIFYEILERHPLTELQLTKLWDLTSLRVGG